MTALSERFLELNVDKIQIKGTRGLRVSFEAEKSLRVTANTCEIKIYNLSPESRAALTKVVRPAVSLVAGYVDEHTSIFYGQAVHVRHERAGGAIVTSIGTTDSGHALQTARIQKSFGPRTKAGDVLRALGAALGVKPGNLAKAAQALNAGKRADIYVDGVSFHGHGPEELTALCRSAGLEWSVQDGALQILDGGAALAGQAIVLTSDLLTVTPSVSNRDIVEAQTFITKDFLPGRQVQIRDEFVTGAFRLEKCKYTGDTHADQWFVDFEGKGAKAIAAGVSVK